MGGVCLGNMGILGTDHEPISLEVCPLDLRFIEQLLFDGSLDSFRNILKQLFPMNDGG